MTRKPAIEASFARRVGSYEDACDIQSHVALRLAELLPDLERPDVLELGCGTGLFTRALIERYEAGRFVVSDLSSRMVDACACAVGVGDRRAFTVIDADTLSASQRFDVVASSMALHWCDDPVASLELQRACLRPGGKVVYATIGIDNFTEWREVLSDLGHENGARLAPALPGVVFEERVAIEYGSARGFLGALKKTGAAVARPGYRPLSATEFKRACRLFDERHRGRITWHIVYGVIEAWEQGLEAQARKDMSVRA